MSEPVDVDLDDDAIDAGIAAWFSVRQVPADRPILRDRMRAAIATALARHQADSARSARAGHHPTTTGPRGPQRNRIQP